MSRDRGTREVARTEPIDRRDSQRVPARVYEAAELFAERNSGNGIHEAEDRMLAPIYHRQISALKRRTQRTELHAMPLSDHQRQQLQYEMRGLLLAAKHEHSYGLQRVYWRDARAIADRLAMDSKKASKFAETAARKAGVSKRTVERGVTLIGSIPLYLMQAIAGTCLDCEEWIKKLAGMTTAEQYDFARNAYEHRHELKLSSEVLADGRLRKFDSAVLDVLDAIGRNDVQSRRLLASLPRSKAVETVARWQREHESHERRAAEVEKLRVAARAAIHTPATSTLGAAWNAATEADRATFMEVHGLVRASVIRGECISNAFEAVEGEA